MQKRQFQIIIRGDNISLELSQYMENKLLVNGWEKSNHPSIVIAIGGDGTILHAFHKHKQIHPFFVGLHTGTLGFYADWNKEEVDDLLEHLLNTEPTVVEYPLVQVNLHYENNITTLLGLNELVIKSNNLSTFVMELFINEQHFETFRGDGMLISTPSGSTAYNLSAHGAVIHPSFEAIQVAELSSINNVEFTTLNRPFILPKHHILKLKIKNPTTEVVAGIDANLISLDGVKYITTKVADEKVKFLRYRTFPFWERVRENFIEK